MKMNALFYIRYARPSANYWERFLITTPDGPHDRLEALIETFRRDYAGEYGRVHGEFVCLTPDDVWKEV